MSSHLRYAAASAHIHDLLRDAAARPQVRRERAGGRLAGLLGRIAGPARYRMVAAVVRPAPHH
jgi:hypothetical protein